MKHIIVMTVESDHVDTRDWSILFAIFLARKHIQNTINLILLNTQK